MYPLARHHSVSHVIKEIDSQDLHSRYSGNDDFVLIDIRSAGEIERGMIPDSEHLPMHLIPLKLNDLPRNKELILYCHSGARSYHACKFLLQNGFENAINLKGGILGWARSGFQIA